MLLDNTFENMPRGYSSGTRKWKYQITSKNEVQYLHVDRIESFVTIALFEGYSNDIL